MTTNTNTELFESLVKSYSDMAYACYSDWAGAVEQDTKRFKAHLASQDIFNEGEIAAEFTKRHNAWIEEQRQK